MKIASVLFLVCSAACAQFAPSVTAPALPVGPISPGAMMAAQAQVQMQSTMAQAMVAGQNLTAIQRTSANAQIFSQTSMANAQILSHPIGSPMYVAPSAFGAQSAMWSPSRLALRHSALQNFRPTVPTVPTVAKPVASVEKGKVQAGTAVKLKSETHYATLYYTTDGWTPTTESKRYTGPITVNEDMHLQVIAVGPNLMRSPVQQLEYAVEGGSKPKAAESVALKDGVLKAGTELRLVTAAKAGSQSAAIGDKLALTLDEDVKSGDTVVVAKGTKLDGVFTIVDTAGGHEPGDLVFEVHGLPVKGKEIPLIGGETLEGAGGLLSAKEAEIVPGMKLIVIVASDTPLAP